MALMSRTVGIAVTEAEHRHLRELAWKENVYSLSAFLRGRLSEIGILDAPDSHISEGVSDSRSTKAG